MSADLPSQLPNAHLRSPNPNAPAFRPSPTRAATLAGAPFQYKTRAASQPAGERIPPTLSNPASGRASPGTNGGGAFGVIGGSRTPGRFGNALAAGGTATRANSFSAGEIRDPRNPTLNRTLSSHTEEFLPSRSQSTSPFPTFSPNSTPSTSPAAIRQQPLPPSPPKVGANASRSRSQSLATGVRPSSIDRPWLGPMSSLADNGAFVKVEPGWNISPPEGASNMSPFSRGLPVLSASTAREDVYSRNAGGQGPGGRFRVTQDTFSSRGGWGPSPPESNTSALTSSVHKALGGGYGQQPQSSIAGAFADHAYNPNGNRSGNSSRRHSVSVVSGPGGRREFAFGDMGMGITPLASPPNRGLFGFEADLGNALSLDIDSRRRGDTINETFGSASVPRFGVLSERAENPIGPGAGIGTSHQRVASLNRGSDGMKDGPFPAFGSTPPQSRGRLETGLGLSGDRGVLGDGQDGQKSRFALDNSSARTLIGGFNTNGGVDSGSPDRERQRTGETQTQPSGLRNRALSTSTGPGPIGSPATYGAGAFGAAQGQLPQGPYTNMRPYGTGLHPGPGQHLGNGQMMPQAGASPMHMGGPLGFGRSAQQGFGGYYDGQNRLPPPGAGPFGGPGQGFGPGPGPGLIPGQGYNGQQGGGYPPYYPAPSSPPPPTSPSFSSLSLSDLGKGISLISLPPTTPLYIVAFKAGRRDVYYCPDPTLLISNGDRVIVEADRGSDLGTVVYDQLTPIDVRDWQERQATAALLSGASQHQPPGMAVAAPAPLSSAVEGGHKRVPSMAAGKEVGDVAHMDLDQLLSGVGPSGQLELSGTAVRGPLAKEVMPKRIFAKSSQGPEEQARMREKAQDEYEALMICREKVVQRGLPMTIVDAEYQWDRRKLTFYFKADKRVDFRDLTKENFRIFKSRIWMSMVGKDDPRL
ncbi:hypothetical protein IAU60_004618 [Kwoniella sp. DSM 27419]